MSLGNTTHNIAQPFVYCYIYTALIPSTKSQQAVEVLIFLIKTNKNKTKQSITINNNKTKHNQTKQKTNKQKSLTKKTKNKTTKSKSA